MINTAKRRKLCRGVSALAAAILPVLPARAGVTLTWDADLNQPGAQGGPGTWIDGGLGWFDGVTDDFWNNADLDSALFAGSTAGTVTISGTAVAQYAYFNTAGYTLGGGRLTLSNTGANLIDAGVIAKANATINSDIRAGNAPNAWIKEGLGTLTLGGNNFASTGTRLRIHQGAVAVADKVNLPPSVFLDGDATTRLLFTAAGDAEIASTLGVSRFASVDVQNAAVRIAYAGQISGSGQIAKEGAGTLAPTFANAAFTGRVRVNAGTLELRDALSINARAVQLLGGTLSLQANTATAFGSAVTSRPGTGNTATLAVGGASTAAEHSLPTLSHVSGTLNVTSANGWGLAVGSVTNGGTIDLNNARLTVASGITPFAGQSVAGTIRFARDPGATPNTTTRGLWLATGAPTTVTSTFAGQSEDADLLVGASGSGTVATTLTLDGSWRGGGAAATSTLVLPRFGNVTLGPNLRFNNLPADLTAAPRPVRIWGAGSTPGGVLAFDPAFVADRTNNGATPDGLAAIDLSNVVWETHHTQSLPVVVRPLPGGSGTYRAGLITFDNFSNASAFTSWAVKTNDQTYDGGVHLKHNGQIALNKNLTLTGRVTPYGEHQLRVAADRTLSVVGGGTLTLAGDLGFAPNTRVTGAAALLVINTDPGAGWYDGNYARNPAAGTITAPAAPSHTLRLSIGDFEGHGGAIFNAPVTRLAELSVAGTAVASLSLPGPQKVLSVSTRLQTYPSGGFEKWLDLTDNAMILGASTNHTTVGIRSLLIAKTIRSSAADAAHGLGYARAGDVLSASPAGGTHVFLGLPVAADDVLVRYTVLGDANLDGRVNFADLLSLAKHYNTAAAQWSAGDFNYDGSVNFNDLLTLAKGYNTALPAAADVPAASAEFERDYAAAVAAVPEPSVMAAGSAMFGFALTTRRKRRAVR